LKWCWPHHAEQVAALAGNGMGQHHSDMDALADVRVLIVDDQLPFREAARMVVEMTDGFEVAGEAANGEAAVEKARDLRPDLVLMDVQMPGMNGLEATERIRALDDPPHILIMSTHESGDYRETALHAGAYAFLPKSEFSMDALEELWRRATS